MNSRCIVALLALVLAGAGLSALGVSVTLRIETVVKGDLIELTDNAITIRDSARGDVVIFSKRIVNSFTIDGEDTVFTFPVSRDSLPEAALEYWDAPAAQQHSTWNRETPKLYAGVFANLMLGEQTAPDINHVHDSEAEITGPSASFALGAQLGYLDVLQAAFSCSWRGAWKERATSEFHTGLMTLSATRFELRAAPWYIGKYKHRKLRVFLLAGIGHSPDLSEDFGVHYEDGDLVVFGVAFSVLKKSRNFPGMIEISGSLEYETISYHRFRQESINSVKHNSRLETIRINLRVGFCFPILTDEPRVTE